MFELDELLDLLPPSVDAVTATEATKQFDFARHWRKRITPVLSDPLVQASLTFGMRLLDRRYEPGVPPWMLGKGCGQRINPNTVSWYQPMGRCHHIAPFVWAIATKLYPKLRWGFLSGPMHTVVIGSAADWKHPVWVMDILNFRECAARQSLRLAQVGPTAYYDSLEGYAASFCEAREQAFEHLNAECR
jgi:hypothetical protein